MVKRYSFFDCTLSCKEKHLLGHTFRIWYNQSPGPNAALRGKYIWLAPLHLILLLSIELIIEQVFFSVIFNSLKLPIFPPCQTAGVFISQRPCQTAGFCWLGCSPAGEDKVTAEHPGTGTGASRPHGLCQTSLHAILWPIHTPAHLPQPLPTPPTYRHISETYFWTICRV